MTPAKIKAKELVAKFWDIELGDDFIYSNMDRGSAKQCALIAAQELQDIAEVIFHKYGLGFMGSANARNDFKLHSLYKQTEEVKSEIQSLIE